MGPEKPLTPISAFAVYKNQKTNQESQQKSKKKKRKAPAQEPEQIQPRKLKKIAKKPKPKTVTAPQSSEDDEIPQLIESPLKTPKQKLKKTKIIDDPTLEAEHLFKWLISPLNPDQFFKKYWEEDVLYIKRNKPKYYSHILSTQELDKILRENQLQYTRNVDVVSYENGVKEVFNQEGRATPSALWDYYNNGCSIRVLNPQTYNHRVHLLIFTLQEYFGTMVGTNLYLTPPGSQGFAPHFDDIEAFIVQLEGRKHWKLYHPTNAKDVLARDSSHNFNRSELEEPFMELTLEAGDILYFPRGTIHEGRTDPESHSLHITISVFQHTAYADLLEILLPRALRKAADSNLQFRRGLPLNYLKSLGAIHKKDNKTQRNAIKEHVAALMSSLQDYLDLDEAADELGKKFVHDSMPPNLSSNESIRTSKYDGAFMVNGRVHNNVEISLDTRVRLLRYYCIRLVYEDATPKLYYSTENSTIYHGEEAQWLELDPVMVPAIKLLQATYPNYVEVEQLPMDDEIMKMQLVSDLWEKGILVTEEPLPCYDEQQSDADSD